MISSLLLTAALWPTDVTSVCKPDPEAIIVGIAKSQSHDFVYCESVTQPSANRLIVNYIRDGKIFAKKELRYFDNNQIPEVRQEDFRFGELRIAHTDDQSIRLTYKLNANKKAESVDIPLNKVDIIDAGFDNFIRNRWDELASGKTLPVHFASMSHQKALPLRIKSQPLSACAITQTESEESCFLVEIDNSFLRLLLGNIKITYDKERQLKTFNGIVNIVDDKESSQHLIIRYFYAKDLSSN